MMSATGKSRKEREIEARKRDILEIAAQLFASRGFHEVKVDDIAESVGLSKGTIYLYFENKENLFFSILTEKMEKLNVRLEEAVSCCEEYEKKVHEFIKSYLVFFRDNQSFYKIVHSEKTRMSMESHYKLHEYGKISYFKLFELIIQLADEGITQNFLRPLAPQSIALSLVGILNMYIYNAIFEGGTRSVDEEVQEIKELFLNGAGQAKK